MQEQSEANRCADKLAKLKSTQTEQLVRIIVSLDDVVEDPMADMIRISYPRETQLAGFCACVFLLSSVTKKKVFNLFLCSRGQSSFYQLHPSFYENSFQYSQYNPASVNKCDTVTKPQHFHNIIKQFMLLFFLRLENSYNITPSQFILRLYNN